MHRLLRFVSPTGRIQRREFFIAGLVLFFVKYNFDRVFARSVFNHQWEIPDYLFNSPGVGLLKLSTTEQQFWLGMLAAALPFLYLGVVLGINRLRDAGLPPWLVIGFFIPVVNILGFCILGVLPSAQHARITGPAGENLPVPYLARLIPRSKWGAAAVSVSFVACLGLIFTLLSVQLLQTYGWGLFVGVPFFGGLVSTLLYGYHHRVTLATAWGLALSSLVCFAGLLFIAAVEGFICLIMAFPIGLIISFVGAFAGWVILGSAQRESQLRLMSVATLVLPILLTVEGTAPHQPPMLTVTTTLEIDAPPQAVWDQLIAFSPLAEPTDLIFQTGIAYPLRAEMVGQGVGAVRHCIFTTGEFVEPITTWDAPRKLAFDVLAQPVPMYERSPWGELTPHHLNGYLQSHKGQFALTELPGGRTRLAGTTWYTNQMWPQAYWQLWSDTILHAIHQRVLEHVQQEAEKAHLASAQ